MDLNNLAAEKIQGENMVFSISALVQA